MENSYSPYWIRGVRCFESEMTHLHMYHDLARILDLLKRDSHASSQDVEKSVV